MGGFWPQGADKQTVAECGCGGPLPAPLVLLGSSGLAHVGSPGSTVRGSNSKGVQAYGAQAGVSLGSGAQDGVSWPVTASPGASPSPL